MMSVILCFIAELWRKSPLDFIITVCSLGVLVCAWCAFYIYKKQADISDTSNLMTTWCEHNRIMASINDPVNKKIKPLKYFELIMFFERICTLYYVEWRDNEKIKKRFHVLYDETIDAHCRKHFEKSIKYLYTKYGRYIYEYGLSNVVKYFGELEKSPDKKERCINHILKTEYTFEIDNVFDSLKELYAKPKLWAKGNFNKTTFNEYRKNLTVKK